MAIFEKNIAALSTYNQQLAIDLVLMQNQKLNYEVVMGEDPANLNLINTKTFTPMYEGVPLDEMMVQLEKFKPYKRYPYLYFFGFGNGIFYKLLLDNQAHKRVVVFEPDIEVLFIVLSLIDFSQELREKRLVLQFLDHISVDSFYQIFDGDAKIYSKTYDLHICSSYYSKNFQSQIQSLNQQAIQIIHHIIISCGNDINDSLIGLENFLTNAPYITATPTATELVKKVKNSQTVVLAATGPSLYKQLPLLYKIQESVTIFCIDASFPILVQSGIKPDFVFSIERVEPTSKFYEQVAKKYGYEAFEDVNIVLTSIVHEATLQKAGLDKNLPKSSKCLLLNRPLSYLTMFELDEWGYLGKGMSAANMAFELTFHGEFENIIIIGQDLAYGQDGSSHTKGNIWGSEQIEQKESDIYVTAYGGEGKVRTSQIWGHFLSFYEKDIHDVKSLNPKINIINATEGGARINGAIEISFEQAVVDFVDLEHKKEVIDLQYPQKSFMQQNQKQLQEKIQEFIEVGVVAKKETEKAFLEVAAKCEYFEKLNKQGKLEEIDYDDAIRVISQIDAIKEMTSQDPFNKVYMDLINPFIISQELELAKIQVSDTTSPDDKKAKMIEWIYAHKFWLFALAGGIDTILSLFQKSEKLFLSKKD